MELFPDDAGRVTGIFVMSSGHAWLGRIFLVAKATIPAADIKKLSAVDMKICLEPTLGIFTLARGRTYYASWAST